MYIQYRWRASIYKLVWKDLIAFLGIYYTLSLSYRFAMNKEQQQVFESVVYYCNSEGTLIPVLFVLGFYVSLVMKRWWSQYLSLPWPDPLAVYVTTLIRGQDDRGRVMRRTIMRYACLCSTIVLTMISPRVKKRFPTLDYLVDAGLLFENEKDIISNTENNIALIQHSRHWMPIVWAAGIVTRARKEGRIRDDVSLKTIMDELDKFRMKNLTLLLYDSVCIPLVYTQVVTLAVYTYFLSTVVGMQWVYKVDSDGYTNVVDYYIPIFTTLEFFFYMGWLKVAEQLINPFGEDDDDFEVNWMIDRNLQVSYLIVDEMHNDHPQLVKDQYWEEVFPSELPYPIAEQNLRDAPPEASTAKIDFSPSTQYIWKRGSATIIALQQSLSRIKTSVNQMLRRNTRAAATILTDSDDSEEKEIDRRSEIKVTDIPASSAENIINSDINQFEQLKEKRERERVVRQQQKLIQNVNTAANATAEMPPEQQANILPLVTAVTALNQIADTLSDTQDPQDTKDLQNTPDVQDTTDAQGKPNVQDTPDVQDTTDVQGTPETVAVQKEPSITSIESAHNRNLNEQ